MSQKAHWSGSSADLTFACEKNGKRLANRLHRSCDAHRFTVLAELNPKLYCIPCARAARLALAKESAPKPEPLAPVVSWPEPRPIADFPIDRPVPVFVPSLGWAIGTALGVCWDAASKKHVATSIVTTDGTVVSPTHFLPIVLPLPPAPEVRK